MHVSTIADNCVLVRLKNGKPRMSRRDRTLEERVRDNEGDQGVVVTRGLFPDKTSPVHECNTLSNAIYTYHKKVSKPWLDAGPRVLLAGRVDDYIASMNKLIGALTPKASWLKSNWDQVVADAIAYRSANRTPGCTAAAPSVDDYMSADDIQRMYNPTYSIRPIAADGDFRSAVNPAAAQLYADELAEAQDTVRNATLLAALDAVRRAAVKLDVPIGDDGSVFRDSLVKNIAEAVTELEDHNLTNDAEVAAVAQSIRDALAAFNSSPEALRTMDGVRQQTSERFKAIADKLGGL